MKIVIPSCSSDLKVIELHVGLSIKAQVFSTSEEYKFILDSVIHGRQGSKIGSIYKYTSGLNCEC